MSKFLPIERYMPEKGQYKLLPFRFEKMSDDEVVLTNAVGEFVFLLRDKLNELLSRKLQPSDPVFQHLRSRQFIRESSDLAPLVNCNT